MTHAAANTASGVGASLLRKEDARHLRGRGQFVSDVQLPRMQDVAFVRSPHAHARIKAIAVAPNASGRIFTARDLPRLAEMRAVPQVPGFKVSGYPPLATQKVRYVGEAIAACIAPTRAEAEDLANAVSARGEDPATGIWRDRDGFDARMGVRAADEGHVLHTGKLHVGNELAAPAQMARILLAQKRGADARGGVRGGVRHAVVFLVHCNGECGPDRKHSKPAPVRCQRQV